MRLKEMNYIAGILCSDGDWKREKTYYSSTVQTLARGDKAYINRKREESVIL
jgi:hypothetical protein